MPKSSFSEKFQPDILANNVLNLDVTFHWIPGSERFWFKRQSRSGDELVLVDAQTGEQSLASATPTSDTELPSPDWVLSPDGHRAILRRGDDLWLRDLSRGQEQRLTHDGQPLFGYGDVDPSYDRQNVARRRANQPSPPLLGVLWSPDSRFILALRQDLRRSPERLVVTEYVPPDGSYAHVHFRRVSLAGDADAPESYVVLIDTRTSVVLPLALDPQALNDSALHYFIEGIVWWSTGGDKLFVVTANRGGSRYALQALELATGEATELLHDSAPFNVRLNPFDYARPNVHVTSGGTEIIWYSERSGYGHLYLYDAAGKLKRQLTNGEWVVFDLLRVDEVERIAYFTAATRSADGNPYYRYLYRMSLDGGEPELLTPEVADHKFSTMFFRGGHRFAGDGTAAPLPGSSISPSGHYIIDSYSTTEQPPEYVLRRTNGELVAKVLSSDASELYAGGWRPPERVITKAADGLTDLYGVVTKPRDFDPAKKYPVIDSMYPGPQGSFAPRTFMDQLVGGSIHHLQAFADAGFIVVAIDGRGTGHRSRAFRDAFLGTEDVFGAADHVAALQHLAEQHPYMDLERAGIRGQSFGGYGSLRAMLLFPDFFKVGVSATGPAGYLDFGGQTNVERFFGVPSDSIQSRAHYDTISNTRLASRLKGRVLLIYGGIDENVPLKHAFAVFDAFIKADKDVDMLVVPDADHTVSRHPYAIRRSLQYFVDHLTEVA